MKAGEPVICVIGHENKLVEGAMYIVKTSTISSLLGKPILTLFDTNGSWYADRFQPAWSKSSDSLPDSRDGRGRTWRDREPLL